MRQFHPLPIVARQDETADSVRLALDVPVSLRDVFEFSPGQHLPVQAEIDGKRVRRSYSICSVPGTLPLESGVRIQPGGA
jgi:ring-1,2-phenylacetyl-CoA epoxidase subunit PaaE